MKTIHRVPGCKIHRVRLGNDVCEFDPSKSGFEVENRMFRALLLLNDSEVFAASKAEADRIAKAIAKRDNPDGAKKKTAAKSAPAPEKQGTASDK